MIPGGGGWKGSGGGMGIYGYGLGCGYRYIPAVIIRHFDRGIRGWGVGSWCGGSGTT